MVHRVGTGLTTDVADIGRGEDPAVPFLSLPA
jgi:hypothetical protein